MRILKQTFLSLLFILLGLSTIATTWDEPWQDEIIKKADCFVYGQVRNNDEHTGFTLIVKRVLAGQKIPTEIKVSNFYALDLCSRSGGHGPEFRFADSVDFYFFLKKNDKGEYCIPTPTSGWAYHNKEEDKVSGTYRHSYHKTNIGKDIYELTTIALFNHYHNLSYDNAPIKNFIDANINLKPAGFSEGEINTFFKQHVALECIYHFGYDNYCSQLKPFLADTANFHNRISAARAMKNCTDNAYQETLIQYIKNTPDDNFVNVLCVQSLQKKTFVEQKKSLTLLHKTASEEGASFGGNIMDPRVCTSLPSVKQALGKGLNIKAEE